MTPRLLVKEFVVARRRAMREHDEAIRLAWTIEALHRHEKLPKLETLLKRDGEGAGQTDKRQNVSQQKAMLTAICQQYGLKMRTKTPSETHG